VGGVGGDGASDGEGLRLIVEEQRVDSGWLVSVGDEEVVLASVGSAEQPVGGDMDDGEAPREAQPHRSAGRGPIAAAGLATARCCVTLKDRRWRRRVVGVRFLRADWAELAVDDVSRSVKVRQSGDSMPPAASISGQAKGAACLRARTRNSALTRDSEASPTRRYDGSDLRRLLFALGRGTEGATPT
jgi:hypothetical protein